MPDFEQLAKAIRNRDELAISRLSGEFVPQVISYLKVVHDAPPYLAEEAANTAFTDVCLRLREEEAASQGDMAGYLMNAGRFRYYDILRREGRYRSGNLPEHDDERSSSTGPMDKLLDEDRKKILRRCLKKLDRKSRYFIMFIMKYPNYDLQIVAEKFSYTYHKARWLKSSLIRRLHDCYRETSKE